MKLSIPDDLYDFVNKHTIHYDSSHDVNHAIKVTENAYMILQNEYPDFDTEIIIYATMLHDVCDHKYTSSITKEDLEEYIFSKIHKKAEIVIDIINNISYSREVKGKCKLLPEPYNHYRNIVSDADKLEALGPIGIARCITYTSSRNGNLDDVIKHCHEKLLLLKDNFIRTKTGKVLAEPLHQYIVDYVSNMNII